MATRDITDLQVVLAYEKAKSGALFPYEVLQKETGLSFKECNAACARADSRGLIDYGVSLRTGWITEKGRRLIEENSTQETETNKR